MEPSIESTPRHLTDSGATMQAVVQDRYGLPEDVMALATIERPSLGDDDVLIEVRATSVNTPDWITVTGIPKVLRLKFGIRAPATPVRGTDISGVVRAVGSNVSDLVPGDEVFGSAWTDSLVNWSGTFAEYSVAPASQLVKKPAELSFIDAGSAVMSGITAMLAMRDVAGVGPGAKVLINGASGGVGVFAVQIAKALGAEVAGVCSTRNVELVRSIGADHVIDYTMEDFTRGQERYDVILDNVINHPSSATARVLTADGMLIPNSIGNNGGWFAGLPRMGRSILRGKGSANVSVVDCVVTREHLGSLAEYLTSGQVKVVIDRVYPLADAAQAVAHMFGHHASGKVAISVSA